MSTMSILAKAAMPVLAKALTVAGKEVSKKAVIITSCAAGGAVVAGGVTAGVVIHNNKKKKDETSKNVANKVDEKLKEEEKAAEPAEKPEEAKTEDVTTEAKEEAAAEVKEETPAEQPDLEPQHEPQVVNVQPQMGPIPNGFMPNGMPINFVNPAPMGPNPAFRFMGQQPIPQVVNPAPQPAPEPEKAEDHSKTEAPEANDAPVDNNDVVITAADVAKGNKAAKTKSQANGKKKRVSVEIPASQNK